MSTNISTAAQLPSDPSAIMAGLANVQQATASVGSDGQFMKFAKGDWSFGADDIEPEKDSLWAVNPASFRHGFQCWGKEGTADEGSLLGEEVVPMTAPPVVKSSLPELNGKWADLIGFELVCTTGEDKGTHCYLASTSKGFLKEAKKFINSILAQMNEDPGKPIPLIKLETDSYKHKTYGKVFTPVFTIDKFVSADVAELSPTTDDEPEVDEPEVEENKVEEAPKRRRRRA